MIVEIAAALAMIGQAGNVDTKDVKHYVSPTVEIQLIKTHPRVTTALILETGDANEVLVTVFYRTTYMGQSVLLGKDVETEVTKMNTWGVDFPVKIEDIEFIRVKEMKLLGNQDFGKKATNPAKD